MAATVNKEIVKAPGSLVISAYVLSLLPSIVILPASSAINARSLRSYATVPNITTKVTPDIRLPGRSSLILIDLGGGHHRLGGSALAHVRTSSCGEA